MLLRLLPGMLGQLGAVLFPAQQQDKNARFQAYKGYLSSSMPSCYSSLHVCDGSRVCQCFHGPLLCEILLLFLSAAIMSAS